MNDYKRFINKKTVIIGGTFLGLLLIIIVMVIVGKKPEPGTGGTVYGPTPTFVQGTPYPNQPQTIIVSGVFPADKQDDVNQNESIKISFADTLPKDGITIQLIPELGGKYTIDTKNHTISFFPEHGFQANTTYEAHLLMKQAFTTPQKESASAYFWTFKTGEQEGESSFTKADAEQFMDTKKATDQAYQDRKKKYPFITSMPYVTQNYRIDISALSDTVTITTFATHPSIHEYYQNEARKWLENKGADVKSLTIRYVMSNP
jgi:hypothetical protein